MESLSVSSNLFFLLLQCFLDFPCHPGLSPPILLYSMVVSSQWPCSTHFKWGEQQLHLIKSVCQLFGRLRVMKIILMSYPSQNYSWWATRLTAFAAGENYCHIYVKVFQSNFCLITNGSTTKYAASCFVVYDKLYGTSFLPSLEK